MRIMSYIWHPFSVRKSPLPFYLSIFSIKTPHNDHVGLEKVCILLPHTSAMCLCFLNVLNPNTCATLTLRVSRASLSKDSDYESDSLIGETYLPSMEFEFVEIDNDEPKPEDKEQIINVDEAENGAPEEEFEFPLFAAPATQKASEGLPEAEERGRDTSRVMKVSLREESLETIKNERPMDYYVAHYSEEQKREFEAAAVTGEDIYAQIVDSVTDSRCLDVKKYNKKVEEEAVKQKLRSSKMRAGKKKRACAIIARERKLERKRLEKKALKEEFKSRYKVNYKQRAKAGSKPKGIKKPDVTKPRFRTE